MGSGNFRWCAGKSGGGPPHSKTLARRLWLPWARSVLECASPLALSHQCEAASQTVSNYLRTPCRGGCQSGGGPPHSKTLARILRLPCARSVLECASPLALCQQRPAFRHHKDPRYRRIVSNPRLLLFHATEFALFQFAAFPTPSVETVALMFVKASFALFRTHSSESLSASVNAGTADFAFEPSSPKTIHAKRLVTASGFFMSVSIAGNSSALFGSTFASARPAYHRSCGSLP